MAIDLTPETVQLKPQDRTFELVISSPASGQYKMSIFRHLIDKDTKKEISRDAAPIQMTLEEMLADADVAPLLASIPPILDRIVTEKRAAAAAAAAALEAEE